MANYCWTLAHDTSLCHAQLPHTWAWAPAYPAASFGLGLALMSVRIFLKVGLLRQVEE